MLWLLIDLGDILSFFLMHFGLEPDLGMPQQKNDDNLLIDLRMSVGLGKQIYICMRKQ